MSYSIKFKFGNLVQEEQATFIINTSNTKLILGSGVSMSFKRHCGIDLQKEMLDRLQEIGTIYKGDVVATSSAKASNFLYALHVAIIDYNNQNSKFPTLNTISTALNNIEAYIKWFANSNPLKNIKIVLPLMGCGVGELDKEQVILLYLEFFSKKVEFDCDVIIYGYSKKDYRLLQMLYNKKLFYEWLAQNNFRLKYKLKKIDENKFYFEGISKTIILHIDFNQPELYLSFDNLEENKNYDFYTIQYIGNLQYDLEKGFYDADRVDKVYKYHLTYKELIYNEVFEELIRYCNKYLISSNYIYFVDYGASTEAFIGSVKNAKYEKLQNKGIKCFLMPLLNLFSFI